MKQTLAFALLAAVAIFLATAGFFPDAARLCSSTWACVLWGALTLSAVATMVRRRLWRQPAVFGLHVALLVILAGALTTHICSTSQRLHLAVGECAVVNGTTVRLDDFAVEYYPGTSAPSDFVATVSVGERQPDRVSMNRVASADGLRIFLLSCDSGHDGCSFALVSDGAGTAISYVGYGLLFLFAALCLLPRLRWRGFRRLAVAALLILPAAAAAAPRTVPRDVADELGKIFIYRNDRVMPLSVFARDFTLKIYGTTDYQGLSPEQVLSGWLFCYDDWKTDPGILVKDADSRRRMGAEGKRVALDDFFGPDGYLFDDAAHAEANEKFALVSQAASGSLWRIYPFSAESGAVEWYSPVSELPADIDLDSWRMTRHSIGYVAELLAHSQAEEAAGAIRKIGLYQRRQCPVGLPSATQCMAETVFVHLGGSIVPCLVLLIGGIVLIVRPRPLASRILLWAGIVWVSALMILNTLAARHLPMANGYETMQWMALFGLVGALLCGRRRPEMLPLGAIVAALSLAVAFMGQRNPQLTSLMPVLRSPLLSVHVLAVMLAYALMAIIALSSLLWLCGRHSLLLPARRLLKPAVLIMAAGIFTGAIWANQSWGRYWGWDPKEIWALVTMIVYCFPLHQTSLPCFRRDRIFALWTMISFLTVLMTYLGVNYLLGGLHSYA